MNYFVFADDGQKYGPADVATLNHWAQEGRVSPTTTLEDAMTGARIPANTVAGLVFPIVPTAGPNYQQASYPRGGGSFINDNGADDVKKVWLFGGLAFIPCCPILFGLVFGILAIVFAQSAQKKGNPQAGTAMTFAIVSLVGGIVLSLVIRLVLAGIFSSMMH